MGVVVRIGVRIGVGDGDVVKVVILVRVGDMDKIEVGDEVGEWGGGEEMDEVILVDDTETSLEIGLGEVNRI